MTSSVSTLVSSRQPPHRRGFTLVEVMVATTILGMATAMTLVAFGAALRRAQHTENMLKGTQQLRYATDIISQAVRSASSLPTTANGGLQLIVPPKDLGTLTVQDTTWLDAGHTVSGTKSNQRNPAVTPTLPAVVNTVFTSTSRPAGAIAASDMSTYFVTSATVTTPKVSDIVAPGDVMSIPATAFGAAVSGLVVNSVSNNAGTARITFTNALGVDVPSGTVLSITSGRKEMFEVKVVATTPYKQTELRYYPDTRNLTAYTVLAKDVSDAPLVTPSNSAGGATVPFTILTGTPDCVVINLQYIPKGSMAGRTLQGVQTTVYTRTDPTIP